MIQHRVRGLPATFVHDFARPPDRDRDALLLHRPVCRCSRRFHTPTGGLAPATSRSSRRLCANAATADDEPRGKHQQGCATDEVGEDGREEERRNIGNPAQEVARAGESQHRVGDQGGRNPSVMTVAVPGESPETRRGQNRPKRLQSQSDTQLRWGRTVAPVGSPLPSQNCACSGRSSRERSTR